MLPCPGLRCHVSRRCQAAFPWGCRSCQCSRLLLRLKLVALARWPACSPFLRVPPVPPDFSSPSSISAHPSLLAGVRGQRHLGWLGMQDQAQAPRRPSWAGARGGWRWWFWPHLGHRGVWEKRHVGLDLGLPGPIRAGRAPRRQHRTGQARSPRVGLGETGRVCSTERVCVCMGTCVLACAVEEFYVCAGEHVRMHVRACASRVCGGSLADPCCGVRPPKARLQSKRQQLCQCGRQDRSHHVCPHTCQRLHRARVCVSPMPAAQGGAGGCVGTVPACWPPTTGRCGAVGSWCACVGALVLRCDCVCNGCLSVTRCLCGREAAGWGYHPPRPPLAALLSPTHAMPWAEPLI